jgi:hypothetical protein
VITATCGAVGASLVPVLASSAATLESASCPAPTLPTTAPPTTDVDVTVSTVTTTTAAAPETTVAPPSTVLIAPPTSEFLPTPTTGLVEFPGTTVVPAVPSTTGVVAGSVDSLPLGLRRAQRQLTAEPAPPPRQKITIDSQLWVDQNTGVLGIHKLLGAGIPDPDPCKVFDGATLTPVRGIPGRYRITLPKLNGRVCKIVTFQIRGKDVPARVSYNAKDDPTITFDVTDPHGSQVTIVLSCDVPRPR